MEQTYLGRSGLVVSELCLGTMTFGGACDLEESRAILDRFREAGGTFLDTADVYTEGRSEEILGKLIADDREALVVASKAYAAVGEGPNDRSASRRHLTKAVEDSLRRLGTDYLDLYQLHAWDPTTPLDETLSTLEDLVRAGKVLHVGVSNFVGWQIERACRLQEAAGYDRFVSLQPQYSLVERGIELETLPAARGNGLGILAWSPLAAGFLTGKYRRDERAEGKGRFAQFVNNIDDAGWATLDAVREVADGQDVAPATVAIAWLRARADVIPIIGATKTAHLDATLAATDVRLSPEELERLDEVSAPTTGYPWDFGAVGGRPSRPGPGALGGGGAA
jgi:aryl-alcohol dehydrogenase-like predicted oxidoreductase